MKRLATVFGVFVLLCIATFAISTTNNSIAETTAKDALMGGFCLEIDPCDFGYAIFEVCRRSTQPPPTCQYCLDYSTVMCAQQWAACDWTSEQFDKCLECNDDAQDADPNCEIPANPVTK